MASRHRDCVFESTADTRRIRNQRASFYYPDSWLAFPSAAPGAVRYTTCAYLGENSSPARMRAVRVRSRGDSPGSRLADWQTTPLSQAGKGALGPLGPSKPQETSLRWLTYRSRWYRCTAHIGTGEFYLEGPEGRTATLSRRWCTDPVQSVACPDMHRLPDCSRVFVLIRSAWVGAEPPKTRCPNSQTDCCSSGVNSVKDRG